VSIAIEIRKNRFPGADRRLQRGAEVIDTKAAFDVYAISRPYTPVDTSALVNNVVVTGARGRQPATVHWLQHYAAYQELGTVRGVTPKRFAGRAVQQVQPSWIRAHQELVRSL
jgi:hypothetical protein